MLLFAGDIALLQLPRMVESVMTYGPNNPFAALHWHLKIGEYSPCDFGSKLGVTVGGNPALFILLRGGRFADVVQQGDPEQVGVAIFGAGFNCEAGVDGDIAFGMIFRWLWRVS